jgi:IS5 family transposase
MFTKPDKQIRFEDSIYDLIPEDNFLRQLKRIVNWSFVNKYCRTLYSTKGRPAYPAIMMVRLLILQFMYNMSDRQMEEMVRYRIDFRWFVGLKGNDPGPDHTVYCRFRDRIGTGFAARIFNEIVNQAWEAGLVADNLSIVDTTDIKAKVDIWRWKDDDENKGGKAGPDSDARFGRKSEKKEFFGYKCGMAEDSESGIITTMDVQPGNTSDMKMFEEIADEYADVVTADKGFDASYNYELLESRGQQPAIIPKHLNGKERGHVKARYPDNRKRSGYYRNKKKRARIEGKFGELKNYHGMMKARYYGITKVLFQCFMSAVAVNLKRMVTLLVGHPRWVAA